MIRGHFKSMVTEREVRKTIVDLAFDEPIRGSMMNRREFNAALLGTAVTAILPASASKRAVVPVSIVDTHAHVFHRGLKPRHNFVYSSGEFSRPFRSGLQ
jgi:hypothetical protein